jgi:thiol-disulfide isomerase/thioredoxin
MIIMKNLLSVAVWLTLATALLAALGCEREQAPRAARKAAALAPAEPEAASPGPSEPPALLARATAGQLLASIAAAGKRATLVSAWASWCGPCRRELPMLQALSVNLKPQGVDVVLVSVDDPKDEAKAASYLKDSGITLESYLVDGSIADFKAGFAPNWPGMLPASFLFDGGARLVHFWGGEAFENEITPVLDDFLAGRPIAPETRYGLAPGKLE